MGKTWLPSIQDGENMANVGPSIQDGKNMANVGPSIQDEEIWLM